MLDSGKTYFFTLTPVGVVSKLNKLSQDLEKARDPAWI